LSKKKKRYRAPHKKHFGAGVLFYRGAGGLKLCFFDFSSVSLPASLPELERCRLYLVPLTKFYSHLRVAKIILAGYMKIVIEKLRQITEQSPYRVHVEGIATTTRAVWFLIHFIPTKPFLSL